MSRGKPALYDAKRVLKGQNRNWDSGPVYALGKLDLVQCDWDVFNLVPRVSLLSSLSLAPGDGKKRDPGNEVGMCSLAIGKRMPKWKWNKCIETYPVVNNKHSQIRWFEERQKTTKYLLHAKCYKIFYLVVRSTICIYAIQW